MSNSFEFFRLPIQFNFDIAHLETAYLRAQAAIHPDLLVTKSALEKRIATSQAATINEAYTRLKNPLTRAEDFLKAKNVAVPGSHGTTVAVDSLLEEILEWRDRIQKVDRLEQLREELDERLHKCMYAFDQALVGDLPNCYLEFVYTHKTLTELDIVLKK